MLNSTEHEISSTHDQPGHVAQSVKCLTSDPEVASLIPALSHTFVLIDQEMISMVILLPSADSKRVVVRHK